MTTLTGDPGSGCRRSTAPEGLPRGLTGRAPPSSTVRQALLPAFDAERRDCRSGRGQTRRPPPRELRPDAVQVIGRRGRRPRSRAVNRSGGQPPGVAVEIQAPRCARIDPVKRHSKLLGMSPCGSCCGSVPSESNAGADPEIGEDETPFRAGEARPLDSLDPAPVATLTAPIRLMLSPRPGGTERRLAPPPPTSARRCRPQTAWRRWTSAPVAV